MIVGFVIGAAAAHRVDRLHPAERAPHRAARLRHRAVLREPLSLHGLRQPVHRRHALPLRPHGAAHPCGGQDTGLADVDKTGGEDKKPSHIDATSTLLQRMRVAFDAADADGDGELTRAEFRSIQPVLFRTGPRGA